MPINNSLKKKSAKAELRNAPQRRYLKYQDWRNIFLEINLFDASNFSLRRCFFFYFAVALCSYLSVMFCNTPYKDDFHRYLANTGVGTISALRIVTFSIESIAYLSSVVTDAAPFTHILSCALLAYSAVICLKIFRVDPTQKWEVLCFVPVVVNQYLLDVMMFRFDNVFIVFALFTAILAAYISSYVSSLDQASTRKLAFLSATVMLLFFSLFMYQAALFAYPLIFVYFLMLRISHGQNLFYALSKMQHWILAIIITFILYVPFTKFIVYLKLNGNSELFLIPNNIETIKVILMNFGRHFQQLWAGWIPSFSGKFCIVLLSVFVLRLTYITYKNTNKNAKSILYLPLVWFLIILFLLAPSGVYYFMYIVDHQKRVIDPRIMYSMGILISLLLLNSCRLAQTIQKSLGKSPSSFHPLKITDIFGAIVGLFCFYNMLWANSVGKIFAESFRLQNCVFHDAARDVFETITANQKMKDILFLGKAKFQKIGELERVFPLLRQLSAGGWDYSKTALQSDFFAKKLMSSREEHNAYVLDGKVYIIGDESSIDYDHLDMLYLPKPMKMRQDMWYEIFHLDDEIMLINLKDKADDDDDRKHPITRLK